MMAATGYFGERMAPVLRGFLTAALLLFGAAPTLAQGYPSKPVRVVVGFPAGGPTDAIARILAQKLSDKLGQQFFVENIAAAGGHPAAVPAPRGGDAGPAVQEMRRGHTPIAFTALPSSVSAVQAGQLRALGVAATERAPGIPEVPTFAEQGVKDQEAETLTGIVVPAGTPKEIVNLLYREIASAVAQPDVRERLTVLGFTPVANTPDEFAARIKLEMEKWGKVVRDAKLRIE